MMRDKLLLPILLFACIALTLAQNDGRYRPTTTARPIRLGTGRFNQINDGRYRGGSDGRYRGGSDGRYVHVDNKYQHDDPGDAGRYQQELRRIASTTRRPLITTRRPISSGGQNLLQDFGANVVLPKGKGTSEGGGGWRIIRQVKEIDEDGYHYLYDTENGILAEESGRIEKLEFDDGMRAQGFYEYTGDDGQLYRVDYVADDRGFVPQGAHIPTTPPHVIKLLAYLAANAPK